MNLKMIIKEKEIESYVENFVPKIKYVCENNFDLKFKFRGKDELYGLLLKKYWLKNWGEWLKIKKKLKLKTWAKDELSEWAVWKFWNKSFFCSLKEWVNTVKTCFKSIFCKKTTKKLKFLEKVLKIPCIYKKSSVY